MKRFLRSSAKKLQVNEDTCSKPSEPKNSKSAKINEETEAIIKNNRLNSILGINSILSSIFSHSDFADLINFNLVCKKWNQITNPIIRRSIKLQRTQTNINQFYGKRFHNAEDRDIEVAECITNNAKYALFVKEFKLIVNIEPQRAIEFFQTFKYITCLTLERIRVSQDLFLSIINPLIQLKELELNYLDIIKVTNNRLYTEAIQLPQSLTKLAMKYVNLVDNPDLFIQSMNSHNSLIEFSFKSRDTNIFLEPFYKNYPRLKAFEYYHPNLKSSGVLLKIFEFNPQLINLKLGLICLDESLTSQISRHLLNLEELSIRDIKPVIHGNSLIYLKFLQPTKIKKLNLIWNRLSSCSINSILFNCPDLEELSLNFNRTLLLLESTIQLNIAKPTNIKKLQVICNYLNEASLDSILLNCPNLKELNVQLPKAWKEWMKLIGERCANLEQLTIRPANQMGSHERDIFFQEICEVEFSTNNSKYKDTLTHLTLNEFTYYDSKATYFKDFIKLRSIKYPLQIKLRNQQNNYIINFGKNMWPNYKLACKEMAYNIDIELIKINY